MNQLSPDFEKLIFDNNIRNVYKIEENEKEEEYNKKYIKFEYYDDKNKKKYKVHILFDMFYEIKNNEDIILIIYITSFSIKNSLKLSLDINLNNLIFK